MSWHYLQEQEEACWLPACLDGAPDVLSSLIPTLDESSSRDNATDASNASPYGMTSRPSTVDRGEGFFAKGSSAGDSRVRLIQPLREDGTTRRTYGRRCSESSPKSSLDSSSRRMSSESPSDAQPKTCSRSVIREYQSPVLEPPPWVRRMTGRAGGFLPTPTAKSNAFAPSMRKWPAYATLQKHFGPNQGPRFWEWMMGWPVQWSDVEPLETDRFRSWLLSHGTF